MDSNPPLFCSRLTIFGTLVPRAGLEPAQSLAPVDFESTASANSATSAYMCTKPKAHIFYHQINRFSSGYFTILLYLEALYFSIPFPSTSTASLSFSDSSTYAILISLNPAPEVT